MKNVGIRYKYDFSDFAKQFYKMINAHFNLKMILFRDGKYKDFFIKVKSKMLSDFLVLFERLKFILTKSTA